MELNLPCDEIQFTANIFYRLLLDNRLDPILPGENYNGNTDKPTETHMYMDISALVDTRKDWILELKRIYEINDEGLLRIKGQYRNAASMFKNGGFIGHNSKYYLLNNKEIADSFDHQVKNAYTAALTKTVAFARRYFESQESADNTDLVKKVLFLILSDDSISDSQEFYICFDGTTKTKADLRSMEMIGFESFLLGVWHYLIVSQKLQTKLEKTDKIIVNIKYQEKKIKLKYSDMDLSEDAEAQYQTDSSNNSTASNISKGKSVEETKDNNSIENNISEVKPAEETEDTTSTVVGIREEQLKKRYKAGKQALQQIPIPKFEPEAFKYLSLSQTDSSNNSIANNISEEKPAEEAKVSNSTVDDVQEEQLREGAATNIPSRREKQNTDGEEHIPRHDCTEELDANDKIILSHLDHLGDMMDDLYKDTTQKCAAIIESGGLPNNVITDDRDFSSIFANNEITLTRNVFFTLLLEAVKTDNPKREKNKEKRLFLDLMELIGVACPKAKPDLEYLTYYDDKFRYLKAAYSAAGLDDEKPLMDFEDKFCNYYGAALNGLKRIREKYFNAWEWNEMLVGALIEFICYDDSIPSTHEFAIRAGAGKGIGRSKKELSESDDITIEFEPFVLDVLHYVFALRNTKDVEGTQTFSTVFLQKYRFLKKDCAVFRGCIKKINEQSDRIVTLTYLE